MPRDVTLHWIIVVAADVMVLLYGIFNWRMARRGNPECRIAFRTTDFWGATLGIATTFVLFATLLKGSPQDRHLAPLALALFIPHQLGGMFILRLRTERGSAVAKISALDSFLLVIGGALMGFLLPALSLTLGCAVAVATILFVLLSPFLLLLMIALFVYKKVNPEGANQPHVPPPQDS